MRAGWIFGPAALTCIALAQRNWWPAVSLQVYCRPMHKFLIYDEYARRCEIALGTYDKILSVNSEPALR